MDSDDDHEFGRGRRMDDSSSKEGSPRPKLKKHFRSLTPGSDDGDLVVPAPIDDDTPPPESAPLIRKAVAFSGSASAFTTPVTAPTYDANVKPQTADPYNPYQFLPGQAPKLPPPKPPKPQPKAKAKKKEKKQTRHRHYDDGFSDHTSIFRLKNYKSLPSDPVGITSAGTGPYSSLYRYSPVGKITVPSSSTSTPPQQTAKPATPEAPSSSIRLSGKSASPSVATLASASSSPAPNSGNTPSESAKGKARDANSNEGTPGPHGPMPPLPPMPPMPTPMPPLPPTRSGPGRPPGAPKPPARWKESPDVIVQTVSSDSAAKYYRTDYDKPNTLHRIGGINDGSHIVKSTPSKSQTAMMTPDEMARFRDSQPFAALRPPPAPPAPAKRPIASPEPAPSQTLDPHRLPPALRPIETKKGPTQDISGVSPKEKPSPRMITVIIHDARHDSEVSELAEVWVSGIRQAPDPSDGYWADAQEFVKALQSTPARIDGPARVFTWREKYRHVFFRISGDNQEICTPSNLKVTTERTIEIFVESPPGSAPAPSAHSRPAPESSMYDYPARGRVRHTHEYEHTSRSRERYDPSPNRNERRYGRAPYYEDTRHEPESYHRGEHPRDNMKRRRRSTSEEYYDSRHRYRDYSPPSPPSYAPSSRRRRYEPSPSAKHPPPPNAGWYSRPRPRSISPVSSARASPQLGETQEEVDAAIKKWIQPDLEDDIAWQQFWQLRAGVQRVSNVIQQYRFVQGKLDLLCGKTTPADLNGAPRQKVERRHVLSQLRLDDKWGSECTEFLALFKLYGKDGERTEEPTILDMLADRSIPQGNPTKRCLRAMREIDKKWKEDHPSGGVDPESDPDDYDTPSKASASSSRPTHDRRSFMDVVRNDEV